MYTILKLLSKSYSVMHYRTFYSKNEINILLIVNLFGFLQGNYEHYFDSINSSYDMFILFSMIFVLTLCHV